jgi:hypothetical protein
MSFSRLNTPSKTVTKTLSTIYAEFLEHGKLQLSPSYQRARCWKGEQNNGLIASVMLNWPTPLLTFYKLQPADSDYTTGFRFECVDGQNRLSAIFAFRSGIPIINDKGKEETVTWTRPSTGEEVTYAELSDEERGWFDDYDVAVTIIQSPMTLEERKAMFTRLQNGTKISVGEYMKNTTHPISQFVSRHALRDRFQPIIKGFMSGSGDWMDVLADCVTLYVKGAGDVFSCLDRSQTDLRHLLKKNPKLTPDNKHYIRPITEEDDVRLLALFERLFTLLQATKTVGTPKCHKFHVTVLFAHLMTTEADASATVVQRWCKTTSQRIRKDVTEGVRSPEIYQALLDELQATITDDASNSDASSVDSKKKRKLPPKKIRDSLWVKHFGASGSGICQCCEMPIQFSSGKWHQAHIVAYEKGGKDTLDNLVPTCSSCNLSCATEDLRDFCARAYPYSPFLRSISDTP